MNKQNSLSDGFRLGFCGWLLHGATLPERIEFLAQEGFNSISWLQNVLEADPGERREAAALLKEKNFSLTYHGNLQAALLPGAKVDETYMRQIFDDVIWWHENTNGVHSCCSDMISAVPEGETARAYFREETYRLFKNQADFFEPYGIRYGIENSFFIGSEGYAPLNEIRRMKERVGEQKNAGMLFDVGHANVYLTRDNEGKMSLSDYINEIPLPFHEIHITDNRGFKDEHRLPGEGTINYAELRKALEAKHFDGVISLEICVDILNKKCAWDLSNKSDRDLIRKAKADFLKLYFE